MEHLITNDPTALRVLEAARNAWERGADLRSRRLRYKRFTYGDQWSDITLDSNGEYTTERDQAIRNGRRPMTNNMIRRLVKCIIGRYRQMLDDKSDFAMTNPASNNPGGVAGNTGNDTDHEFAYIRRLNHLDELDCRMLEEFLISGCAVQRIDYGDYAEGNRDVRIDNVSPARFFTNPISDPRGWDVEIVGMLHDMSITTAVMRFAKGDARRAAEIRRHFAAASARTASTLGRSIADDDSFGHAAEGRCRVIEVWTLEAAQTLRCHDPLTAQLSLRNPEDLPAIETANRARRRRRQPEIDVRFDVSTGWRCRWLSPSGAILDEYSSPYPHGSHPFVIKLYPLTDGEVHSLVEDVIDQQLYVNRLITLIDHVIGASAKGALLFPEQQLSDGYSIEEIARMWAAPDAVIPYAARTGVPAPQQLVTNGANFGARELLAIELKMFEDVSGVSGTLLGNAPSNANAGYERYRSELQNASANINDIIKTFSHFCQMRDKKIAGLK